MTLSQNLRRIWNEEEGAALVEYGLIVGLIAAVCIAGVTTMGTSVNTMLETIAGKLPKG